MATTPMMAKSNGSHHLDTLTLSLHAFSDNDMTVFRSMLALFAHKLPAAWAVKPNSESADLHIVDVDCKAGRVKWRQLQANGDKVAYSARTLLSASQRIRKPLLSKQLYQLLEKTSDRLMLARHGGMPLIDHLERGTLTTAVSIEFDEHLPELWIDPHTDLYLFGCELARIQTMLATPFMVSELRHVGRSEWRQRSGRVDEQPLSRLYWYAAWATSGVDLVPQFSPSEPIKLLDWPDMEAHRPEFFRLAGHLLNDAISFDQLVNETRIDRKLAARFINACDRCGLIGSPGDRIDHSRELNAKKSQGLLSRVRQRVGF